MSHLCAPAVNQCWSIESERRRRPSHLKMTDHNLSFNREGGGQWAGGRGGSRGGPRRQEAGRWAGVSATYCGGLSVSSARALGVAGTRGQW